MALSLLVAGLVALSAVPAHAQAVYQVSSLGCFSDHSDSDVQGSYYTFQTSDYCQVNCSDYHYMYIRQFNCYCTDTEPTNQASDCTIPCPGFGTVMCGGSDSYSYWVNELWNGADHSGSESSSAASTTSHTATSASSATSGSTSATDSASTNSDTTTNASDASSTGTSATATDSASSASSTANNESSATGTATSHATSSTTSSPSSSPSSGSDDSDSGKSGVSGGTIAGIVVGVLGAIAIIAALILLWRHRQHNRQNAYIPSKSPLGFTDPFSVRGEDKMTFGGPNGGGGNAANGALPNSFMAIDQRLNPVMLGERRLSEGSIADERDYSRKILRVANPDDS